MNYKEILQDEEVKAFLQKENENLGVIGYSEHEIKLAEIAGALHDIGNAINRKSHGEYGALLAYSILERLNMPLEDRIVIISAIGNHDESTGEAVDAVTAALILADKTDVQRNRVRNKAKANFDKHDRVKI